MPVVSAISQSGCIPKVSRNITKIRALLCVQQTGQATLSGPDAEIIPLTLREPCPCCGGPMRVIEIFRCGQKPMSRGPPREQAA